VLVVNEPKLPRQNAPGDCGDRLTMPLLAGFCVPVRELFVA
jgi:hypothetical protein